VSWRRRLAPPLFVAGLAAAAAAVANAITEPYAEHADEAYRHGAQTGVVLRYALLGAVAGWLLDLLVRQVRAHGSLRSVLSDRGAGLLQFVGLVAVVLIAAIPPFVGGYDENDRLRDTHAGFVDGCHANRSARFCECVWTRLRADPDTDTLAEFDAMRERVDIGEAPAPLQRAVNRCSR
jgi:hypothetical protein